jgi:hypothetical protein
MALYGFPFEPMGGVVELYAVPVGPQNDRLVTRDNYCESFVDGFILPFTDYELNPINLTLFTGGGGIDIIEVVAPQYIRGRVIDYDGNGIARTVICVDRSNGRRLAVTTSNIDGFFELRPTTLEPALLIAVPIDGEQINAVVLDNILPVPE